MQQEPKNRTRIVGLRLTPEEFQKIEAKWKASTRHKLSQFIRDLLFEKPITTIYRNSSEDDFLAEMAQLRKELNHIGNNFNQAVKRLHTLHSIQEFQSWLISYDVERKMLLKKVNAIQDQVQKVTEKWLQ